MSEKEHIEKIKNQKKQAAAKARITELYNRLDKEIDTTGWTSKELYAAAGNNHLWSLGTIDEDESLAFELISDIMKERAKAQETKEKEDKNKKELSI